MKKIIKIIFIMFLMYIGYKTFMLKWWYHTDIISMIYSEKGIDVSHHQIKINWKLVDGKKYKFVIMKATEGKDFLDSDFYYNWTNAQLNGFKVGAYHFFTMLSSGSDQADFYISKVPLSENTLPPVVDLEISTRQNKEVVLNELNDLVKKLENKYNKKVIFYVNYNTYNAYIKGEFLENPIWITDFKFIPRLEEDDRWVMWQYSRWGRVKGIDGFTDKNVLRKGTIDNLIKNYKMK